MLGVGTSASTVSIRHIAHHVSCIRSMRIGHCDASS